MNQRSRRRAQPRLADALEPRQLMAAAVVAGNVGQLLQSQFQPYGFRTTVGSQVQDVRLGGPFTVDVLGAGGTAEPVTKPAVNTGLIRRTQFNGGGFQTVGLQLRRVRIGGGLAVFGRDNEDPPASAAGSVAAAGGIFSALNPLINKGLIRDSQFNDGGFGIVDRLPDGRIIARAGRVGFQWRDTRVGGPVAIGIDDEIIRPGATAAAISARVTPGTTVVDPTTTTGRIRDSQVNDGGFGDIGLQWDRVAVGRRVATSTNTLFIEPRQDGTGPITVADRVFGTSNGPAGPAGGAASAPAARVRSRATAADAFIPSTQTNGATNSGRITGAQFNDGGFGDVGLQWKQVRVRSEVTAVHNSLTVQPENRGQGLITVRGVRFPSVPPATLRAARRPQRLASDPAPVASDGDPVAGRLPTPTEALNPSFPTPLDGPGTVTLPFPGNLPLVNAATNSGLIRGGQFNAGGFGDSGLQWLNVRVGGHVKLVHNSLSVHPEGSQLAGIAVADVNYGRPVSKRVARQLAVLDSAVIAPGTGATGGVAAAAASRPANRFQVLGPPNDRILTDQQLAAAGGTDVFLQWNGLVRRRGLVLVHNIIKIIGVGPTTGPITLNNIRFPYRLPDLAPIVTTAPSAGTVTAQAQDAVLLNASNNSGLLNHAQFSDGGFGDDGLQWRDVRVDGSVDVVHNTLAVDATADLPLGDVAGPLTVSRVTFNSGALRGVGAARRDQLLLSPPNHFRRRSARPLDFGTALDQDPAIINNGTNSGVLNAGQLAAGRALHAMLQWQGVRVRGPVKVIDNVLAISVRDRPAGPITISDVTFA